MVHSSASSYELQKQDPKGIYISFLINYAMHEVLRSEIATIQGKGSITK